MNTSDSSVHFMCAFSLPGCHMHMSSKHRGVFISSIFSPLENNIEEQYLFHIPSPDMQVRLNQEVMPLIVLVLTVLAPENSPE